MYAADRQDAADTGFIDAFLYDELQKPMADRSIVTPRTLRVEAVAVLNLCKAMPDKAPY